MNFASSFLNQENCLWVVQSLAHVLWQGTLIAGIAAVVATVLRSLDIASIA